MILRLNNRTPPFQLFSATRGKRVADQIDAGMVFIRHPIWPQADLSFGGTKRYGDGRELSELGIDEFVNKKLIRIIFAFMLPSNYLAVLPHGVL